MHLFTHSHSSVNPAHGGITTSLSSLRLRRSARRSDTTQLAAAPFTNPSSSHSHARLILERIKRFSDPFRRKNLTLTQRATNPTLVSLVSSSFDEQEDSEASRLVSLLSVPSAWNTQNDVASTISALQDQCRLFGNQQLTIDSGIVQTLLNALGNEEHENIIARFPVEDLKVVTVALQLISDSIFKFGGANAQRALKVLIKIADVGGPLPPNLFTTGVRLTDSDGFVPCFGGFSNVFKGTIKSGELVALKRIRVNATKKDKPALIRRMHREALVTGVEATSPSFYPTVHRS